MKEKELEAHVKGRNVSFIGQTEIVLDNNRARKHPRSHQVQSVKLLMAKRHKTNAIFSFRAVFVTFVKSFSRILFDFSSEALEDCSDDVKCFEGSEIHCVPMDASSTIHHWILLIFFFRLDSQYFDLIVMYNTWIIFLWMFGFQFFDFKFWHWSDYEKARKF